MWFLEADLVCEIAWGVEYGSRMLGLSPRDSDIGEEREPPKETEEERPGEQEVELASSC